MTTAKDNSIRGFLQCNLSTVNVLLMLKSPSVLLMFAPYWNMPASYHQHDILKTDHGTENGSTFCDW